MRLFAGALSRVEPPETNQLVGQMRRHVEGDDNPTELFSPTPSSRGFCTRRHLGLRRPFPHRFEVRLAHPRWIAGLAGFPHALPHVGVQLRLSESTAYHNRSGPNDEWAADTIGIGPAAE